MNDPTEVTVTVTYEVPGQYRKVEARWPVTDEPEPHRIMVARQLRYIADEVEAGQ